MVDARRRHMAGVIRYVCSGFVAGVAFVHHHRGRTKREERTESAIDAAAVRAFQSFRNEAGSHRDPDAGLLSLPGRQIARVTTLQLRNRECLIGLSDREIVGRLANRLEPPEYSIAVPPGQTGLE